MKQSITIHPGDDIRIYLGEPKENLEYGQLVKVVGNSVAHNLILEGGETVHAKHLVRLQTAVKSVESINKFLDPNKPKDQ